MQLKFILGMNIYATPLNHFTCAIVHVLNKNKYKSSWVLKKCNTKVHNIDCIWGRGKILIYLIHIVKCLGPWSLEKSYPPPPPKIILDLHSAKEFAVMHLALNIYIMKKYPLLSYYALYIVRYGLFLYMFELWKQTSGASPLLLNNCEQLALIYVSVLPKKIRNY